MPVASSQKHALLATCCTTVQQPRTPVLLTFGGTTSFMGVQAASRMCRHHIVYFESQLSCQELSPRQQRIPAVPVLAH